MIILQCLHIIILDLKKLEFKKNPHLQDNCYKQIFLSQIDYKNHVSLQMATDTSGLLKVMPLRNAFKMVLYPQLAHNFRTCI